jgi:metal-responsive CopG/Arc/MetJ family transcriptional regulator
VLEEAERECRREGESRSDLVRRALEFLVARTREEAQVAVYLAGYIAEPESDDERAAASATASSVLEASEWE